MMRGLVRCESNELPDEKKRNTNRRDGFFSKHSRKKNYSEFGIIPRFQ
jgi:hypothetical protein